MWFDSLTGFVEGSAAQVRQKLEINNNSMTSAVNGRTMTWGAFEFLSLADLRLQARGSNAPPHGPLKLSEVVANAQELHMKPQVAGAMFQVASQFNMLEMVSPNVTPEAGVSRYQLDRTQGPACAIACGAGTIYRNYFVPIDGQLGQSQDRQLDGLQELGSEWNNRGDRLWRMQNGYALATEGGLQEIHDKLVNATAEQRDQYRQRLRIGIQWDTEVTLHGVENRQLVSQAYCSALPVAYSPHSQEQWSEFAQLILEAAYEATFWAAVLNHSRTGNNMLFLTLLGGGAFGNRNEWILSALKRSLYKFSDSNLDVAIVSFGSSKEDVQQLVSEFRA